MVNEERLEQIRRRLEKMIGVRVSNRRIKSIKINSRYHW